jgi:copper homeostasis protein
MDYRRPGISMGGLTEVSEFDIAYASEALIRETLRQVRLD